VEIIQHQLGNKCEDTLDQKQYFLFHFDVTGIIEMIKDIRMPDMNKCFKALANKHRLEIFEYLRKQEIHCSSSGEGCNVGDIAQQFDLALSTVSHHLKELFDAELINCVQRGQFVCCTINHQTVAELQSFFSSTEGSRPTLIDLEKNA